MAEELQSKILKLLTNFKGADPLKQLFWSELNYDKINQPLPITTWPDQVSNYFAAPPLLLSGSNDFYVIYARLKSKNLSLGQERLIINKLLQNYPYALFVFSNVDQDNWHFVNVKYHPQISKRKVFRRITIRPNEHYRTAVERLSMLDLESVTKNLFGLSPIAIQERHDEAFDVEKIEKNFFLGYRDHFWEFIEAVRKSNKGKSHFVGEQGEKNLHRFTQLLLGRILFLYFVQKKGWLNDDKQFVQNLFKPYQGSTGYSFYWDRLEPLFFNGLNTPGKEKKIDGKKYDIPYLNGGLFEAREDLYEGDSLKHALVPDLNFQSLFNFLDSYNFTIAESTPLDQDVDIDPEMLGKVFENLLAAEDRHASGTYYTPRTIVEFMCRESLFYHLSSEIGINRAAYNDLFEAPLRGGLPDINRDLARAIQGSIRELKVLDPAVGSGAFLLGMLHELIHLRSICGRALGESEAVQTGRRGDWKREIIGGNLFGVDINSEACEIARLRLWLSMVVDEVEPSPLPNLDYRIVEGNTLREKLDGEPILPPQSGPGYEKEEDLFRAEKPQGILFSKERESRTASIVQHLAAYYQAHADIEKRRLRALIQEDLKAIMEEHWDRHEDKWKTIQKEISDKALRLHKKPADLPSNWAAQIEEADAHLKRIRAEREALKKTGTWSVTTLRLFFAEAFAGSPGGFDIVIANPPYVRQELIRADKPQLQAEFGNFFASTADLYTYFYARGIDLLCPNGILCFISPNKFMRAGYGKNTRRLLTTDVTPRLIFDFGDLPIFEATTYPAILLLQKKAPTEADKAVTAVFNDPKQIEEIAEAVTEISFPMLIKSLSESGWTLDRPEVLSLIAKLREKGVPLGEYVNGKFYRGILTGLNEAFVIDEATRKRLIQEDSKSKEIIKPWLRGRDIKKWQAEWAGLYVIFTRRGVEIKRYPAIKKYLEQFKEDLVPKTSDNQKRGRKPGPYEWYEIQDNIAYYAEFERPKIIYPNITKTNIFSFDDSRFYTNQKCFIIPTNNKYLLAVLNSSLVMYWFKSTLPLLRGGFYEPSSIFMKDLPIFPASDKQKASIVKRVEAILKDPTGPAVPRLEGEIDELVFELYELTNEEIKMIISSKTDADVSDQQVEDE